MASKRSSLILKLPFAIQLTGRQANVMSELLVTSFLDERRNKNGFKEKRRLYTLVDLVGKRKIVKEKIVPQSQLNTYLHNSFTNAASGGKL